MERLKFQETPSSSLQTPLITLPKIHSLSKLLIKRAPSLGSIHKKEAFSKDSKLNSERDGGSHRVSTPEIKRNIKILSGNEWKSKEKSRLKEKMREKSLFSSVDKSAISEKSKEMMITQHSIQKFYLEYNQNHHFKRKRFVTKQEIAELLGIPEFHLNKEDAQLKEIIDNYPDASFLDFSLLKIQGLGESSSSTNLTSKLRSALLNNHSLPENSSKNTSLFTDLLQDSQHKNPNNTIKNPSKRQGLYEMVYFLDKISEEIMENKEADPNSLEKKVFSMQKACKVCIQSFVQEISQECRERGSLLQRIWDLNIELLNITIQKKDKYCKDLELKFMHDLQNLKSVYKDKLESVLQENAVLKNEIKAKCEELKKKDETCAFYKEKTVHCERVRKLIESNFDELRQNYEILFQENLKLKLSKLGDSNLQKREKEIMKKALEEIDKIKIQRDKMGLSPAFPRSNPSKVEGLFKKLTSGELNTSELKETTGRFMMQMTNLSFNVLEFPKKIEDYIEKDYQFDDKEDMKILLSKEIAIDTCDLLLTQEQSSSTKDFLQNFMKDQEVQTVLIDEITDEGLIMRPLSESMLGSELIYQRKIVNNNNDKLTSPIHNQINLLGKQSSEISLFSPAQKYSQIRKRVFAFNQESLLPLEKNADSFTVTKILDFYSSEMLNFYSIITKITEEFMNASPSSSSNLKDIDWFMTYETIINNKAMQEQFVRLLHERDKKKTQEILQLRIENIQKSFDNEELKEVYQALKTKFCIVSRRFEEFYGMVLQEEADKLFEQEGEKDRIIKSQEKFFDDSEISKKKPKSSSKRSEIFDKAPSFSRNLSFSEDNSSQNHSKNKKQKNKINLSEKKANLLDETLAQLPSNKTMLKIQSPHYASCSLFYAKIKVLMGKSLGTFKEKNLGGYSTTTLLKNLCPILMELLKRIAKSKEPEELILNPFFYLFYEYLYNRHALSRENTETRLLKIVQSCIFYENFPRIRNILRLMSLSSKQNYCDGFDLLFYLCCLRDLDDTYIGAIKDQASFEEHKPIAIPGISLLLTAKEANYIGINKAMEVLSYYFRKTLGVEGIHKIRLEEMINKIKSQKIVDPLISRKYVVDVDLVAEMMLDVRNEGFAKYREIFTMIDLQEKDALSFEEFKLIIENIESPGENLKEIFEKESDCIDENKFDRISFRRFAVLCEKKRWFLMKNIEIFEKNVKDEILNWEILKKDWEVKQNLIRLKFIKANKYNAFFNKVIKRVDELIKDKNKDRSAWLLYRVIDEEANKILVEFESIALLAKELLYLNNLGEKLRNYENEGKFKNI